MGGITDANRDRVRWRSKSGSIVRSRRGKNTSSANHDGVPAAKRTSHPRLQAPLRCVIDGQAHAVSNPVSDRLGEFSERWRLRRCSWGVLEGLVVSGTVGFGDQCACAQLGWHHAEGAQFGAGR